MRLRDWRLTFLVLLLFGVSEFLFAGSTTGTPLLVHEDPKTEKEFQNIYQKVSYAPSVFISSGAPAGVPSKIGDITIATATTKIYIATATSTSNSWCVVN